MSDSECDCSCCCCCSMGFRVGLRVSWVCWVSWGGGATGSPRGSALIQKAVGEGMKLRMEAMSKPGGEVRKPCCAIWSRVELVMVKKEALSRGGGETVREPDLEMEGEVVGEVVAGRPEMLTSSPKARMSWSMSLVLEEEEGWGGEGTSSL